MSSQDNGGMFSVRRQTLGPVSHNVTSIPMPASAMKRSSSNTNLHQAPHTTNHARSTSGSRMSLAPGRPSQPIFQRSSSGDNMGFSTVQRQSTANFLGSQTGGRKSYAPVTSTPATSQPQFQESAQRRSSVYSARPSGGFGGPAVHQSFFTTAPPQASQPADPRRLRDPNTRGQMGQELMEFLAQRNFEMEMKHTLTHKSMTSPTQKDFNLMFQFLYHCVDPGYRFQKNIDKEGPPLLKQLRYPFEKNISQSQWSAVGGNNWSTFLGMLHWMMQLSKMMEHYSTGAYDDACIDAGHDVGADRITFEFLSDAYREWLSIEDDDDDDDEAKRRIQPHVEAMAAKFEQSNLANLEQVRQLEEESKALQEQIDELAKSAPKLAKLDETIKVLEEDRGKFETYNQSMESRVEKYQHRANLIQEQLEKYEQELREAEEERDELQRRVDEQGLSVQDIDRMNSERERLQKGTEATSARLEEAKGRAVQRQTETGAKLDELESLVQKYNSLGYQIGIIPSTASNAHGQDNELTLTPNAGPNFSQSQLGASQALHDTSDRLLSAPGTGYQPHHLLPPTTDLRALKKSLQDLRKEIGERRAAAWEDDLAKVDMLDRTKEALNDKYAELETLGHRLRGAQEEFERNKDVYSTQNVTSDAAIERMEKELARMRAGVGESVQLVEQREMATNLEYEQLQLHSSTLREELHTELERMLNDIIKFKIHIQGSLEGYEDFVAGEFEREEREMVAGEQQGGDEDVFGGEGKEEGDEGGGVDMSLEE